MAALGNNWYSTASLDNFEKGGIFQDFTTQHQVEFRDKYGKKHKSRLVGVQLLDNIVYPRCTTLEGDNYIIDWNQIRKQLPQDFVIPVRVFIPELEAIWERYNAIQDKVRALIKRMSWNHETYLMGTIEQNEELARLQTDIKNLSYRN